MNEEEFGHLIDNHPVELILEALNVRQGAIRLKITDSKNSFRQQVNQ